MFQCWAGIIFLYPPDLVFKKLQKVSVLTSYFETYKSSQGINIFIRNLSNSQEIGSHEFGNSRLSFGSCHQLVINIFQIKPKLQKKKLIIKFFKKLKNHRNP
jgi:hypothetical protein